MASPVVSIGPQGSSRYSPPDFSPIARGLGTFGAGIGQVFKEQREEKKRQAANEAMKSIFAGATRPDGTFDQTAFASAIFANPDSLSNPNLGRALNIAQLLREKPTPQRPMKKDANGVWRYIDGAQEKVFRNVTKTAAEREYKPGIYEIRNPDGTVERGSVDLGDYDAVKALEARKAVISKGTITGAPGSMAPRTRANIEQRLLAGKAAALSLTTIAKTFKPEYLTYRAGIKAGTLAIQDATLQNLTPEDQKFLRSYTIMRQRVYTNMNKIIHKMSGTAVGVQEAKRLAESIPTMKDSPIEFGAKLYAMMQDLFSEMEEFGSIKKGGGDAILERLKTSMEMSSGALANRKADTGLINRWWARLFGGGGGGEKKSKAAPAPAPAPRPAGAEETEIVSAPAPGATPQDAAARFRAMSAKEFRNLNANDIPLADLDAYEAEITRRLKERTSQQ